MILMYHRVAEVAYDPWQLAVSPTHFADQLEALRGAREIVSMRTLVERLQAGRTRGTEVALTFDDGYRDNLTTAKPLLEQAGAPATVFLSSARLGAQDEFWWDELAHLCLGNPRAIEAEVVIDGTLTPVRWGAASNPGTRSWHWEEPPPGERERTYLALWRRLRPLGEEARTQAMAGLRAQLGKAPSSSEAIPLRREEVANLIDSELITVGGHARSHLPLTCLDAAARHGEIAGCKSDLEALTGRPIEGFSYPYGDRDDDCMARARQAGYAWAVSTHAAPVESRNADCFDLPRLAVSNCRGAVLLDTLATLRRSS